MISEGEFRTRQAAANQAAAERGLDALVAMSRGGGTHDRIADVLWLTGLAASQPFVPDLPGHWRGAGHVAAVVPSDGPVIAIAESDQLQARPVADETVISADVVAATARALAEAVPHGGRIGILGDDVIPATWKAELESGMTHTRLEPADDLGAALRVIKSPAEQELLRASGALGSRAMEAALERAVPGASEADVAAAFFEVVVRGGGAVYDVVVSSGPWAHTLAPSGGGAGAARWSTRTLRSGELLRIDAYGSLEGYLFDFARSLVIGGRASGDQATLLEALEDSVASGIAALRPGAPLSAVAARCESSFAASGFAQRHGIPSHTMDGFWGHGLGLGWEPPWIGPDSTEVAEAGMCLAVERRVSLPGGLGAQYEDNVLVGASGAELLTRTVSPSTASTA